jgi:Domain of unknown function (DUF397)
VLQWRKLTVTQVFRPDLSAAVWRKSSYSNQEGGDCLEVADGFPGLVLLRDSKRPDGATLVIPAPAFIEFVTAVRDDLPTA